MQQHFAEHHAAARSKFLAACAAQGLAVHTHTHPEPGPEGDALHTDATWLGPRGATRLVVLVSGVHGVEALAGSALLVGLLAEGRLAALPGDTAVLLIHTLNCWGAAHLRRNTEGNIDLCRNFVDFTQALPARAAYEAIHPAVSCAARSGPEREAADAQLQAFIRQHGMEAYIEALMGGQFTHADGFSFGGHAPCWARRTLEALLAEHAQQARHVAVVEVHTGLGPWAYGTAVTMHVGEAAERARRWYGPWLVTPNLRDRGALAESHRVHGHTTEGYLAAMPQAEVTAIVLEFGTVPPQESLPVMMQDHWLHLHGDPASADGRAISQRLLALHHPADPDWREAVWERGCQVVRQAVRGVVGGG